MNLDHKISCMEKNITARDSCSREEQGQVQTSVLLSADNSE